MWQFLHKNNKSPFRVIIFGFFLVILMGSFLLMLPISTKGGISTPFLDALFTSTSAVCVTGLVIHDTATYWSNFGQFVIILLIQIGGLGVVTVAGAFAILSGRKIGLMQRSTMQEAIAAPNVGGIVRLTEFILKTALMVELLGAALLFPVFFEEFGLIKGAWYALFHSISAFCNAGFDLMGVKTPFSSLTDYACQPVVCIVIALLIVVGGIGFLTWEDVRTNRLHLRKYRMQSKVILAVTSILILLPTIYFFFFEFADAPIGERTLLSVFQAITPRTAGFNTADLTAMSETGQLITGHEEAEIIAKKTITPKNTIDAGKNPQEEVKTILENMEDDIDEREKQQWSARFADQPFTIKDETWRGSDFFETAHLGGNDVLKYNKIHPFFKELDEIIKQIEQAANDSENGLVNKRLYRELKCLIDLLIISYSKAEGMLPPNNKMSSSEFIETQRYNWGEYLKRYLNTWKNHRDE